jgi:diamine N-acetyltransferase
MEINLKRATVADAKALSAMAQETFYETFTGTCTEEDMQGFLETYYNLAQTIKELSDETDFFYLAYADDELAGYVRFKEDYEGLPEMKKWKALELKRLYVKSGFYGKGIAQKLMDFTIDYALEKKYEAVFLGVWEHNLRAQKFYSKYHFVYSGHTHPFPIGNTPQTDIWLWRFF